MALCFALLQNKVVYNAVSGVEKTYRVERAEDGSKLVTREKRPFNRIENEQLLQWDADIYRLMSQHLYDPEYVWPGYVAFFPLFPMVWRLTGLSPIGICLLNFVLFVAGRLVLIAATNKAADNYQQRFAVLLCMPFLVIFLIPYSEALFFLCISVGLYPPLGFGISMFPRNRHRDKAYQMLAEVMWLRLSTLDISILEKTIRIEPSGLV